jgi:O-antigen/teichoic acid export membrane protein
MPSSINDVGALHRGDWWTCLQRRAWQHLRSAILRNASWALSAQTLQLAGRFGYFVIAAHVLGPTEYGTFVACTAFIAALSPFASFGTEKVLVKYIARDQSLLQLYVGNALLVTVACGSFLTLLAVYIRPTVLPASATAAMLAAVAIADLFGRQITAICCNAFAATEQFRRYTQLLAGSTALRLVAALVLAASTATALKWAYLYAVSTLIGAFIGLVAVARCCGSPRFQFKLIVPSIREGFHFSTSAASQSIYNDIDKTMLARLSTVDAAAIYAVAYRFVEAAMLPISSVTAATYPEFFRRGVRGVTSSFTFARNLIRRSVVYGLVVGLILFVAAGVVPSVMGREYAQSVAALRWLCVLPAIKSVHAFLTDTLTGADYQWQRSLVQIFVAGFNILVNLWIIRAFAWRGAAWSSVITDLLLAVLLYLVIRWHLRREHAESEARTAQPVLAIREE